MHVKLNILDMSHVFTVLAMMPVSECHKLVLVGKVIKWTTFQKKNQRNLMTD